MLMVVVIITYSIYTQHIRSYHLWEQTLCL